MYENRLNSNVTLLTMVNTTLAEKYKKCLQTNNETNGFYGVNDTVFVHTTLKEVAQCVDAIRVLLRDVDCKYGSEDARRMMMLELADSIEMVCRHQYLRSTKAFKNNSTKEEPHDE